MKEPFLSASPEEVLRQFLSIKNGRDVADLLEVKYDRLIFHLYKIPDEQKYNTFIIPKKVDGVRVINSPATSLKIMQQKLNEILMNIYKPKPSVYGYVRGRNIVLNARRHRRARFILNLDLDNFFPSINFGRVRGLFMGKPYNLPSGAATVLAQICCFKNILPQGAPTSPMISNMICAQMDSQLQNLALENKCYYTRYADDITFSTFLREFPEAIASLKSLNNIVIGNRLQEIIGDNGFGINIDKVRLQPRYRRQEVTGITVNEFTNVKRSYVRQVRAMLNAWNKHGLTNAEKHYFLHYDKHRNPDLELPSFRQIVKGKIEYIGLVKGKNHAVYRRFLEKYHFLHARDKGVPRLTMTILEAINTPTLFVEGKIDAHILRTAWKKLYNDLQMQFTITVADTKPYLPGGSAGAATLQLLLNAHRPDDPYIVIGLFDRDGEGKEKYKNLQSDFVEDKTNQWKLAKERKAGAMLLPIPAGKENYDHYDNLCIEFYFNDDVLDKKTTDGFGLTFDYMKTVIRGKSLPDEKQIKMPEIRTIKDAGKLKFAEEIVPSLGPSEFEPFRFLFDSIINLINKIQGDPK